MTRTATSGDHINLSELNAVIHVVKITANWTLLPNLKNPPEGDMFCFLRDKNGRAPQNEDFVFFNQLENADQTVLLTTPVITEDDDGIVSASQSLILHLDKIRYEIVDLALGFNLYRADERDQSFRYLEKLTLDIALEDNTPLMTYNVALDTHKSNFCLSLLTFLRDTHGWAIDVQDEAFQSFNDVAREHGIVVAA